MSSSICQIYQVAAFPAIRQQPHVRSTGRLQVGPLPCCVGKGRLHDGASSVAARSFRMGTLRQKAGGLEALGRRPLTVCAAKEEGGETKVLVVGAGGRTGSLVLEKLLSRKDRFVTKGLVRGEKSVGKVQKGAPSAKPEDFVFADITDAAALTKAIKEGASGYDCMVLLTSAVPKIKYLSLIPVLLAKITGGETKRPEFAFPPGASPEEVDWLGAKNQVDAAKAAGIKRFIFVGSMGGTQIDNFLNTMGGANILLWKRKAEHYLVASGLEYTIIHPGGLKDEEGGKRQLFVDVDDNILAGSVRSIPRADVAELVLQCITMPQAANRSFDLASQDEGTGTPTKDFIALIGTLEGKNCDYSLPKNSPVPLP
mmetsp:Transcript_44419/g.74087  ORF Transcript_44419/g.74087 Transcript_44419/m.74087 type:complete len:369 (+) Transcript_44419:115-1221(+)|eukprot:CAMPEP_0198205630 /NCGR_PEP_ID=MMETSP1445-20131203/9169_1 /TAXON_ID=36898 /ORGANISM="Pyramimonas sp., Strain CCMP2087" /LENGTH=368 /DNA_ID=CAMNT_0043878003 /DNA_START=94 /DNA_END=1200 /DNA_ORIENTATION=-